MDKKILAATLLQALALAHAEQRAETLDTLVERLRVRRKDVRDTLTVLHRQGMVDVLRMRLTLSGFAIGSALIGQTLPALRAAPRSAIAAA
ncbi:hypothetical protein SOCE26_047610 [Sorangium cellulosum]|uniref:HTH iclR-type domain-containing protein n=1 Tax=Sorangium cellulosum TaxID=56 RepID=A0A2L0EVI6_SORCE|nr:hypothetical protein [Sorangium cellulosum]AUX43316.1 hypothetical protein SOCE26_047610 [Sorangium cellulosum]